MSGTITFRMINSIPKFDGVDYYVEWSRSFTDILQTSWCFLSKIVSGLEKLEPNILRSREKNLIGSSDYDTGNIDEREPSNVDGTKAWGSAKKHLFRVLRLTTITGAARSVLLKFELKYGRPRDENKLG